MICDQTEVDNDAVLASLLKADTVPMDVLQERYGPLLKLMRMQW